MSITYLPPQEPTPSTLLATRVVASHVHLPTQFSIQRVSQKNPPWSFLAFTPNGWEILSNFYTPVVRSNLRTTTKFYWIICNFDQVMPNKARPPSSNHMLKMSTIDQNARWHFLTLFPKRLGIFSPNFARLLYVSIYVRLQIFIQLSPTVTKLCHIKCDHPACVWPMVDILRFVVSLNIVLFLFIYLEQKSKR